jgi:hypothetical protein
LGANLVEPCAEEVRYAACVKRPLRIFKVRLPRDASERVSLQQPRLESGVVVDFAPCADSTGQVSPELLFCRHGLPLLHLLKLGHHRRL